MWHAFQLTGPGLPHLLTTRRITVCAPRSLVLPCMRLPENLCARRRRQDVANSEFLMLQMLHAACRPPRHPAPLACPRNTALIGLGRGEGTPGVLLPSRELPGRDCSCRWFEKYEPRGESRDRHDATVLRMASVWRRGPLRHVAVGTATARTFELRRYTRVVCTTSSKQNAYCTPEPAISRCLVEVFLYFAA